jgi:ureidoacrylate peracid hydrolase
VKTVNGVTVYSDLGELTQPDHTALLVVDVQNDMCAADGWMARHGRRIDGIQQMLPRLISLVAAARTSGVLVVFIQQTTLADNASDPASWLYFKTRDGRTETDYTLDGTWGQELLPELERRPTEPVVKKFRPSAFHETNLDALLRSSNIESVVVAGVITQGCVLATLLDASFTGYYAVLAEDCVQSFSEEQHDLALRFLRSRYDVSPGAEIAQAGGWIK